MTKIFCITRVAMVGISTSTHTRIEKDMTRVLFKHVELRFVLLWLEHCEVSQKSKIITHQEIQARLVNIRETVQNLRAMCSSLRSQFYNRPDWGRLRPNSASFHTSHRWRQSHAWDTDRKSRRTSHNSSSRKHSRAREHARWWWNQGSLRPTADVMW